MNDSYSFLKDELALAEIRKHKWIESEKLGREIGAATAALDWIKRYGQTWKLYRSQLNQSTDSLSEKRRHRRFTARFPVQLSLDSAHIDCHTDDISLIGMSCTIPACVPNEIKTRVVIRFQDQKLPLVRYSFEFDSKIARVVAKTKETDPKNSYNIFVPFNEEIRDYLRSHVNFFAN